MPTQEEFLTYLSGALHHLYDPGFLSRSPLVTWFNLGNQPDTFSSLQKILLDGIEAQAVVEETLSSSPDWQAYEPLFYRFVQQMGQEEVARNLSMSVRHLRRKEHSAIQVLGSYLWSQYNFSESTFTDQQLEETITPNVPSLADELDWLRKITLEKPARLEQIVHEIAGIIDTIAARYDVHLSMPESIPDIELPIHETAVKQALLNIVNFLVSLVKGGSLEIHLREHTEELEILLERKWVQNELSSESPTRLDVDRTTRDLVQLCGGKLTLSSADENFSVTLFLPLIGQIPVLVIDDNNDTLQLLQRYATGTRFHVIPSRDPGQLFPLIEHYHPRIVIIDVMMPGIDGWQLLMQIRQNPLTKDIPVVVCTILLQQETAEALDASGFLQKPVMRQAFLAMLNRQVERMERESH